MSSLIDNSIVDIKAAAEARIKGDQIKEEKEKLISSAISIEERLKEKVLEQYIEFIEEPIDPVLDNYEIVKQDHRFGNNIILKVFIFEPKQEYFGEEESIFLDVTGTKSYERFERTFPIAKVLKAHPESVFKSGDFVKLGDYDAGTIKNPRYEAWVNNEYKDSNLDQIGTVPPKTISNFYNAFGKTVFVVNPLSEVEELDYSVVSVFENSIVNKIKDPRKFI